MLEQIKARSNATQAYGHEPRSDHQQRDRSNVDTEQINLDKFQCSAPVSK